MLKRKKKVTILGTIVFLTTVVYLFKNDVQTPQDGIYGYQLQPRAPENGELLHAQVNTTSTCEDCMKKDDLLSQWPKGKPKGVIYILTQKSRQFLLQNLLESLDSHFNAQFSYPIVIFHEEMDLKTKLAIQSTTQVNIFFQKVHFSVPDFVENVQANIRCTSSVSYRHMCRFNAKGVYEQQIMEGFDYHWRLDDDSLLTRPIKYDIFQFMQSHDYLYGYIWIHVDASVCVHGLWEASENYIREKGLRVEYFYTWKNPQIFYNNFEVSSAKLWESDKYRAYIDYIDHQGGIYHHRWGDAPIKGIAVSMFVPRNKTHHFKDIGYRHGSYES